MQHIHPDDLLAQVCAQSTLVRAWTAVSEDIDEDGSRALKQFEHGVVDRLAKMADGLASGEWRPHPVSHFDLPKSSGGTRTMSVSTVGDRVVERALLDVLTPVLDPLFSPWSFGFRRGLGVRHAIAAVEQARDEGCDRVMRCDIDSAFDRIPRVRLLNTLAAVCPDARVVELVRLLLCRLDGQGLEGDGIGQGSALSPLLLNLYLDRCDRELLDAGCIPIRYADDYAVPGHGLGEAEWTRALVVEALSDLELEINERKTRIFTFDEGVSFLGKRITSRSHVRRSRENHPQRISLYVTEQGALVRSRGERVRVTVGNEVRASQAWARLRAVVCFGRVLCTPAFLRGAAERGVDVVLMTEDGGYVGRLNRRHGPDVALRRAQFATSGTEAGLWLARSFAAGKVANQRVLIRRQDARSIGARRRVDQLERMRDLLSEAETPLTVMGIEGMAAKAYWDWWSDEFEQEWGFKGRNKRPPRDPINAMLSYGYTILAAESVAAVESVGLDPDVGFLHSDRWGRPSLALDLMEEFRPVIVDSVVLGLVSRSRVRREDFSIEEERGCRMTQKANRALVEAYERRMLTEVSDARGHGQITYREHLHRSARRLADALSNTESVYRPFTWR